LKNKTHNSKTQAVVCGLKSTRHVTDHLEMIT